MSTKSVAHQVVPGAKGAESAGAEQGAVRSRDSLFHWCGTADAIRGATTRPEKRAIVNAYFIAVAEESVAPAARLFVGEVFPTTGSGTRRIEWEIVVDAIQGLVRVGSSDLRRRCAALGDIGSVAAEAFAGRLPSGIPMSGVARWADDLVAATDPDVQRRLVADMLARLSSLEARYIVQLIVGELQIGLDPADVEAALAARHASSGGQRRPDRRRKGRA